MLHAADPVEVFPWNANFETGIPLIDEQHRKLVDLLNRLAIDLAYNAGDLALNQVIDELSDYANYHFKAEEAIWSVVLDGDEWLKEHRQAHKAFFVAVAEMRKSGTARPSDEVFPEILRFLINWLAQHILDKDMRMARVLSALDDGLTLEQAKARADKEMSGSMRVFIDTLYCEPWRATRRRVDRDRCSWI